MPPPRRRGGDAAGGDRGPRAARAGRHAGDRSAPRRRGRSAAARQEDVVGAPQRAKATRRGRRRRSRPACGRGGATRRWPQPTKAGVGAPQGVIAARVRRGRGDTQATARATRRRLQPAKVAEGTSRRGPHGSGRKQHTGDRRRGVPRCLSDTTCAGADRRGPYRRKERATADAGGGHPLAGRRSTPPGAPPRPSEGGAPPRPPWQGGEPSTPALAGERPRRPPWQGKPPPCRPARKRGATGRATGAGRPP